jgi:hypothetical protein
LQRLYGYRPGKTGLLQQGRQVFGQKVLLQSRHGIIYPVVLRGGILPEMLVRV